MNIIIISIHVAAAVILVFTVLLQAGKGSGMGAAFGGASGTVFGTRGPATLISKITCAAAVIFMITSLNLSLSQSGGVRMGSIMDDYPAPAASPAENATTPAESAPAPAESAPTPTGAVESAPAEPAETPPAEAEALGAPAPGGAVEAEDAAPAPAVESGPE